MSKQHLVARIRRSSKYAHQAPAGDWFDVEVAENRYYQLSGNSNCYDITDVAMGMRLSNGAVLDFTTGKTIAAPKAVQA